MTYYVNIHEHGQDYFKDHNLEFSSLKKAKEHLLLCFEECYIKNGRYKYCLTELSSQKLKKFFEDYLQPYLNELEEQGGESYDATEYLNDVASGNICSKFLQVDHLTIWYQDCPLTFKESDDRVVNCLDSDHFAFYEDFEYKIKNNRFEFGCEEYSIIEEQE
jgi:hypothetical protein